MLDKFFFQLEAFYSVMAVCQALKQDEWDKLYEGADAVEFKDAVVFNKYILAGMQMLDLKDKKTVDFVNYPLLLKAQLKANSVFGQGLILKTAFERGNVITVGK